MPQMGGVEAVKNQVLNFRGAPKMYARGGFYVGENR